MRYRYHQFAANGPPSEPTATVDVGIAVHDALEDVVRCLSSVAATRPSGTRIIIVDDGSGSATHHWLQRFASKHASIDYVRHTGAQGYTHCANEILQLSTADYVVLLNSDTIVPPRWVERLVACGDSASDIGIIGPLSNAASWQSVPTLPGTSSQGELARNGIPASWSLEDVDLAVRLTPSTIRPRVPLVNGFCYAIKRSVIDAVGYFDEGLFPRGYGEEDDYVFRASDAGFSGAIAMDLYVFHGKSRSFGPDRRRQLTSASGRALRAKWGDRRIDDAIATMLHHPVLAEKRNLVGYAYGLTDDVMTNAPLIRADCSSRMVHDLLTRLEGSGFAVDYRRLSPNGHSPEPFLSIMRAVPGGDVVIRTGRDPHAAIWLDYAESAQPVGSETPALHLGTTVEERARRLGLVLRLLTAASYPDRSLSTVNTGSARYVDAHRAKVVSRGHEYSSLTVDRAEARKVMGIAVAKPHPTAPGRVPTIDDVVITDYDFLDFGAGTGGSLVRCEKLFGGHGLGIEVNARKITEAREMGRDVVFGNIYALPRKKLVRYVSLHDVLEHLPTLDHVFKMLEVAVAVGREFIYIVHPSFDDEAYLRALGLKQYWHDWTGHPTHILTSDFVAMFRKLGIRLFDLEFRGAVWDSSDHTILPAGTPRDQHQYDEELHGPKPLIEFAKPVHRQLVITVPLAHQTHRPHETRRSDP